MRCEKCGEEIPVNEDTFNCESSGTEANPATNLSKQVDEGGAADGAAVPKHWGRAILKDASGNPVSQLEEFDVIPAL